MGSNCEPFYVPALRLKKGERDGFGLLASDVAERAWARLIVPPKKERDDCLPLFADLAKVPDISAAIADVWYQRIALIDSTYLLPEFGYESAEYWLPSMFETARRRGIRAVPCVFLDHLQRYPNAFRATMDTGEKLRLAIVMPSGLFVDLEHQSIIRKTLSSININPEVCIAIADFSGEDLSSPNIVSPIIRSAVESLQEIGLWNKIAFQGSYYPEKNPAPADGGHKTWPRNEWIAWRQAVSFDTSTAEHMLFGDYGADCSLVDFDANGGRAIPHVRWAFDEYWQVDRGSKVGSRKSSMHRVYERISKHRDFPGGGYSAADAYVAQAAADILAPHGNPTIWRQLNMTHHITKIVNDIAKVRGVVIKRKEFTEIQQSPLFPSEK